MSDLFGRSLRLAKTYLDSAQSRIKDISAEAQEELTRALDRDDIKQGLASSDDPMDRAQAKIAATRTQTDLAREQSPGAYAPPPAPGAAQATDPTATAYKILGVAPGADILTVQTAANTLRERCDPARFPAGSPEQAAARTLLGKVEDAYKLLQAMLDPHAGRFDRLEL